MAAGVNMQDNYRNGKKALSSLPNKQQQVVLARPQLNTLIEL